VRGAIHWDKVIGWAIAVIVIAIALYSLVFVSAFEALFPSDLTTLKQYSTCALAYCAAGAGSDEVNAVGCLKYKGGRCEISCAQVEKEVYLENDVRPTVTEVGGRGAHHYCGPAAALEFEFSGVSLGGIVPLASGQMDRITTKPQWVCKPVKIPFVNVELDSLWIPTVDIQHGGAGFLPQNCIILAGKVSPILSAREGCFLAIRYDESYDDVYFTPIIEYDDPKQIIYPSAIYVDRSFTEPLENREPECEFRNSPVRRAVSEEITQRIITIVNSPAEIGGKPTDKTYQEYYDELGREGKTEEQKKLAESLASNYLGDISSSEGSLIGNVLNRCNFRTTHDGEKIMYKVWAKPVYPTVDALKDFARIGDLEKFVSGLLGSASPDLRKAFQYVTAAGEEETRLILSQLGGSCTAVVLSRDLPKNAFKEELVEEENSERESSTNLELRTDKTSYLAGETVKVSGTVGESTGGELAVEMLREDIKVLVPLRNAELKDDGSFSFEYKIPEGVRGVSGPARFKITATYGGEKTETKFIVE
jgi:hypothetical protein